MRKDQVPFTATDLTDDSSNKLDHFIDQSSCLAMVKTENTKLTVNDQIPLCT
jgi:hypothetical protein